MSKVFIDASSAILLHRADLFLPCARTFSLVMAEAVFREITIDGYPGASFFKTLDNRQVRVQHPVPGKKPPGEFYRLDRGEQETLALFLDCSPSSDGSFIIIDDGKGAKFCRNQRIPFINALLVPKIFWYSGLMDTKAYEDKTAKIIESGRYSAKIIKKAGTLTKEELTYFLPERPDRGDTHGQ